MQIINCKTNHMENPMGYAMEYPVFSWQVEEALGKFQTEARILISQNPDLSAPCYDSGLVKEIDSLAYEVQMELAPCTRYYWNVTVKTDAGEENSSVINWFETGKMDEEWCGQWIACKEKERHPVFEKRIAPKKELAYARLYICGLGVYEASIDGKRISDEFLTPYCNNYDEWLQYQTYDVTDQLLHGGTLKVLLGNGWCLGRFGYFSKPGDGPQFQKSMKLIAEIRMVYADGSEEIIGTDESWKVRRSNLVFSNIYDGEHRDDTLPETGEEAVIVTEETTKLSDRYSLPVMVQEEMQPLELIQTPAGESVFDMGQNMTGIFRLRVNESAGTKIYLQFGEVLQGGNFYRDNLRSALAEYWYVSNGSEQVVIPHFTFYGYRYVKVEGIKELKPEDFTALPVYSSLAETGRIVTGHEKVNRLILNTEWGLKSNFLDVPTDCPQRDERMGWTGDAQVFSPTACFLRDSYGFYRKYLYDMWMEQKNLDGKVPDVVPSFGYHGTACVWGDAACIIPWNLYLFYGDISILKECFESMKAWVEYIRKVDGENHGWREEFHYGDWLALDNPAGGEDQCMGGTEEGYIADIYYAQSAGIVAKAAKLLDKKEEAREYGALEEKIRQEVQDEYFSPKGRCCINTQTALLLALKFNLTADKSVCREMLKRKFKQTKGKLQTGFVGTPLLCNQLTEEGMERLAYDLLLNEEYPGWLYEVNLGATTIWERWNSLNSDGTVSSTGMNSFNHYAYGSIVEWMFRHIAGLNPVEGVPGFRQVDIKPKPDVRVGFVKMVYESAAGVYEVYWKAEDDRNLMMEVTVPFGCEARLVLPYAPASVYDGNNPVFADVRDGICYLKAGHYAISYTTAQPMRRIYSIHDKVIDLLDHDKVIEVLEEYIPGITNIPDAMRNMMLKEAAVDKTAGLNGGDALEELDKKLYEIL